MSDTDSGTTTGGDELPPGFGVVQARPKRKTEKTLLPTDYKPGKFSIICGRGKGSYTAAGNAAFRALVKNNLQRYHDAPGRLEKSFIVSEVLNMIRESCPVGAFVKCEKGRWYDLDDTVCREKVGSLFRDFLHTEYKSSSKAKHAKKLAEKAQGKMLHDDIQPKEVTEVAAKAGQQLPVPTQTQKHGETSKQVIAESATVVAPQTRQVNAVLQNQQFPVPAPRPLQRPNQVTTATTGGAPQIRQYQPQQLPIIQAPQSFPTHNNSQQQTLACNSSKDICTSPIRQLFPTRKQRNGQRFTTLMT